MGESFLACELRRICKGFLVPRPILAGGPLGLCCNDRGKLCAKDVTRCKMAMMLIVLLLLLMMMMLAIAIELGKGGEDAAAGRKTPVVVVCGDRVAKPQLGLKTEARRQGSAVLVSNLRLQNGQGGKKQARERERERERCEWRQTVLYVLPYTCR